MDVKITLCSKKTPFTIFTAQLKVSSAWKFYYDTENFWRWLIKFNTGTTKCCLLPEKIVTDVSLYRFIKCGKSSPTKFFPRHYDDITTENETNNSFSDANIGDKIKFTPSSFPKVMSDNGKSFFFCPLIS